MSAETPRADLASTLRDIAAVVTFLRTITGKRISVRVVRDGLFVSHVEQPTGGAGSKIKSALIGWDEIGDFETCCRRLWEVV